MGWASQEFFSTHMAEWWNRMPFGYLSLLGAAVWLGYFLYDLNHPDSRLRALWIQRFATARIKVSVSNPAETGKPLQVIATITLQRFAPDFGCYVRAAKAMYYISGGGKWEWSEQNEIAGGRNMTKGRVFEVPLLTLHRAQERAGSVELLGEPTERPGSGVVCFEIVAASRRSHPKPERYVFHMANGYAINRRALHEMPDMDDG